MIRTAYTIKIEFNCKSTFLFYRRDNKFNIDMANTPSASVGINPYYKNNTIGKRSEKKNCW